MIKQYIKQALRMIGENKLLSVISILGTALAICMIMVIVILYVVNTASFKPEVNRGRTCYITTVMSNGKDDNRRLGEGMLLSAGRGGGRYRHQHGSLQAVDRLVHGRA